MVKGTRIGSRRERSFFDTVALMLIGILLIDFWHSYSIRSLVFAPMPSLLVGTHGALFVDWMGLFVVLVLLVESGRIAIHRRLGPTIAVWNQRWCCSSR